MSIAATPLTGIPPHGGVLIDRYVDTGRTGDREASDSIPVQIELDDVALHDLFMIADGALSPLTGFMGQGDYESVVESMTLSNGLVWSIPITLPISPETASRLRRGDNVALLNDDGTTAAFLTVSDVWQPDLEREAEKIYRTTDRSHPGVARLFQRGDWYVGGEVRVLPRLRNALEFASSYHSPHEARAQFASRGWRRIVAFQTRNPIHRAHEYIQKCALELVDGLLLHPLVGRTKSDDIPADVRLRSYQVLVEHYYPVERVLLSVFPAAMRYAGPREAVFHAIARKNYGCTHFIVGRDHAGVGNFYGTYDAQRIFDEISPEELGIIPLFFDHTYFCRRCDGIVSQKTCPHDRSAHLVFSGTEIRQMLSKGERLPAQFSRPEVVDVLLAGMNGNGQH